MKPHPIPEEESVVILNYEILDSWVNAIKKWGPNIAITDEAHYLKNGKSKRTKAFWKIVRVVGRVMALTGTPIVNAPIEFYRALKMIDSERFSNFWEFAQKYCAPKHNGFGWDFRGSSNEEELYNLLTKDTGLMLRRSMKDVIKELDDVTRCPIWIKPPDNIEIDAHPPGMKELEEEKQKCIDIKMPYIMKWVDDFLVTGEKFIIFAHHRAVMSMLKEELKKRKVSFAVVDGTITGKKRQEQVNLFQKDPSCKVLLGNIKAAGVGLTLTASHHALMIEFPWTPSEIEQLERRLNRIGQEEIVFIHYMAVIGSVEERIIKGINKKARIISKVVDGKEIEKEKLLEEKD